MTARDMLESYLRKWRRKLAVEAATPHVEAMRMVRSYSSVPRMQALTTP